MSEHSEAAQSVLSQMLHAERAKAGTYHVDCWACEASQSEAMQALAARVVLAEAASSHANAVLARAVPEEADQLALWQAHWAEQIAPTRDTPTDDAQGGRADG